MNAGWSVIPPPSKPACGNSFCCCSALLKVLLFRAIALQFLQFRENSASAHLGLGLLTYVLLLITDAREWFWRRERQPLPIRPPVLYSNGAGGGGGSAASGRLPRDGLSPTPYPRVPAPRLAPIGFNYIMCTHIHFQIQHQG